MKIMDVNVNQLTHSVLDAFVYLFDISHYFVSSIKRIVIVDEPSFLAVFEICRRKLSHDISHQPIDKEKCIRIVDICEYKHLLLWLVYYECVTLAILPSLLTQNFQVI